METQSLLYQTNIFYKNNARLLNQTNNFSRETNNCLINYLVKPIILTKPKLQKTKNNKTNQNKQKKQNHKKQQRQNLQCFSNLVGQMAKVQGDKFQKHK